MCSCSVVPPVSIARLDVQSATVSNFAGGSAVGASWTDKIMQIKSTDPITPATMDDDDDGWVRLIVSKLYHLHLQYACGRIFGQEVYLILGLSHVCSHIVCMYTNGGRAT
jgi:hypothetical protein